MVFQVSPVNLINLIIIAAGIGVSVLCFLHITVSRSLERDVRRCFQFLFLLLLLYITTHLARQLLDGQPGQGVRDALYPVTFAEMLSAGFLSCLMSLLVLNVTKPRRGWRSLHLVLAGLISAHAVLLVAGSFSGFVYTFDGENVYHRGPGYLFSNLFPLLMLILNMVLLVRYRRKIQRRVKIAFWNYMIAPIAAILIQSLFYGVQYIILASVAASVYMYFVIIREQRERAERQSQMISRLQNGLILVLADMVESRDKCTGDHVRKTAEYTRITLEQLRRDGAYPDRLTDDFIADVVRSAPLHDVGKIQVPDAILNKPGKLTPEEFEEIKKHTTAGRDIISSAIDMVSEESSGYLIEARNLAWCHHEKWDGTGYPRGLAGEDIPLSARIMAVADVFDALVSRRSYKEPFPFDRSMEIIREGSGTHFDPKVAQAFLRAEAEVRRVAGGQDNASGEIRA